MTDMKPVYAYIPRQDHKLLDEIHQATGISKSDFIYLMVHLAYGMGDKFLEEISTQMLLSGPEEVQATGRKIVENCFATLPHKANEYS